MTRDFIESSYVELKKANPTLPILVRECSGVVPKAWARYGRGEEVSVPLDGLSAEQVGASLAKLNRKA
ncbi:hypothetical protein HAZT_HAZT010839 [Hyalella azteca]|uniref:NADH dehydrogenase [ubiquinone] 1 alpha subcomplex subunit 2 n=1 Tax=Hyalella azteca TaxID=294128 RepID=A0A6A0GQR0_HYAAZ|nr:hypothetical protein HAZT_HAZT010839 [Hyalella azteca]